MLEQCKQCSEHVVVIWSPGRSCDEGVSFFTTAPDSPAATAYHTITDSEWENEPSFPINLLTLIFPITLISSSFSSFLTSSLTHSLTPRSLFSCRNIKQLFWPCNPWQRWKITWECCCRGEVTTTHICVCSVMWHYWVKIRNTRYHIIRILELDASGMCHELCSQGMWFEWG